MQKKSFKETVLAMSRKEIVMSMIEGLENPRVEIEMGEFVGKTRGGTCFGCAATCAVLHIMSQDVPSGVDFDFIVDVANLIGEEDKEFVKMFEYAIDDLRQGLIGEYNMFATRIGLVTLPEPKNELPTLDNSDWKEFLDEYKDYAATL